MEADEGRRQQYGTPYQPAGTGRSSQAPSMGPPSSERFMQVSPATSRGDMSRIPITRPFVPGYGAYGYQDPQYTTTPTLSSSPMQGVELQYPPGYTPDPSRQSQLQSSPQYSPYGQGMMVTPGSSQSVYESMPHFQQRQAAAVEVLTNQFGMPQYLSPSEHQAPPMPMPQSQYIATQPEQAAFSQQIPTTRSGSSQQYMPAGAPFGTIESQEEQEQQAAAAAAAQQHTLNDGLRQYREHICESFDLIKSGRVNEAADVILEQSRWLLASVRALDLHHDRQEETETRLEHWREFNLCWEALGQKQKQITQDAIRTQQQPGDILSAAKITSMIDELIKMCDQLEPLGLVDYEMGVWEEQIVHIFSQCLDLLPTEHATASQGQSSQSRPPTST